jgi:hypothetical protein
MSWVISTTERDPYRSNVSLHLRGTQSGGEFVDISPNPKTITRFGDVAPGSPGGGSPIYPASNPAFGSAIAFDGTGDYLTVASNADFNFGSGDWTIECWFYLNNLSGNVYLVTLDSATIRIYCTPGGQIGVEASAPLATAYRGSANSTVAVQTWYQLMVSKSDTRTYTLSLNGSAIALPDVFGVMPSSLGNTGIYISSRPQGGGVIDGYVDEVRITKGIARQIQTTAAPFPNF